MCQAKYEVLKPCYLTTDEETCNALTYVGSCSDTTIVNESECIGEGIEWTPGQQRCEYKNSNCYPIGETSVETCCQKRTGFCINNYDSNEDYTVCSGTYKLTSNIEIKKEDIKTDEESPHVCCENRIGYCQNNTDNSEDIDCSLNTRREKPEDIQCGTECNYVTCCDIIDDKCINLSLIHI